jgi:hypothetical protein
MSTAPAPRRSPGFRAAFGYNARMTILAAGGAGFIGAHLVRDWPILRYAA